MSMHPDWDAALNVYIGRNLIFDFKHAFGVPGERVPEIDLVNNRGSIDEFNAATARNSALNTELFDAPLLTAVVNLMPIPAPDMAAVRMKAEIADQRLKSAPELRAIAFDHIAADIERLTGAAIAFAERRAAA